LRFDGGGGEGLRRSALAAVGEILDRLEIRWVVFGALAANLYRAETRFTQDLDLLLQDAGPGVSAIEAALASSGWKVRRAIPDGTMLRARHVEHGDVDLVMAGTPYQHEALARAREEVLGDGTRVRALAVEDVVLHKLIAGRTRDIADVESILDAAVPMDEAYLERWASEWEVLEAWRRLRDAAQARSRERPLSR
jgi:predicted nucleotidyltransferase